MKQSFLEMLKHTADSLSPNYIFIGNEVNFYWEQDSVDYLNFVYFYHQAYDSIKFYSPNTKVGTIFNYEHLSGNGTNVGWTIPYWNALHSFDTSKIDVFGLTVYPFFEYNQANLIPGNYLNDFYQRVNNKEVYLTETGWPADSFIGTWTCSPQQQEVYIDSLVNIVANGNVIGINWLFLHYLMDSLVNDGIKIFNSVSLRDSLGNDRPALSKWQNLCTTTGVNQLLINQSKFIVYPNPANETIRFLTDKSVNIQIFNNVGQLVLSKSKVFSNSELSVRSLPNGVYSFQIEMEGGSSITRKLIINH